MKKARPVKKPARRKGNPRPLRLTCERNVSLTPEIDAGVERACSYLGCSGSAYIRDATLLRLINDRIVAPPTPQPLIQLEQAAPVGS